MSIFLFPIFIPPNSWHTTQCWWNGTFTYQVYPKNDQLYKKRSDILHCSCGPFLVSPCGCILTRRLIIAFTSCGTRKKSHEVEIPLVTSRFVVALGCQVNLPNLCWILKVRCVFIGDWETILLLNSKLRTWWNWRNLSNFMIWVSFPIGSMGLLYI